MIDIIVEEKREVFGFDVYYDQYLALLVESSNFNLDIHLYDLEKGERLQSLAMNHSDNHAWIQLFSADKAVLVSKGTAYLLDFGKGTASPFASGILDMHIDRTTLDFSLLKQEPFMLTMYKLGEENPQDTVELPFDYVPHRFPMRIAAASGDFYIAGSHHLFHYNKTKQKLGFSIEIKPKAISEITLHPRKEYICFLGNNHKGCFLYDLKSEKQVEVAGFFDELKGGFNSVRFHPNGKHLVVGNKAGKVMLVDFLSVNDRIFNEELHKGEVTCVIVSESGKYVYSSGQDGRIVRLDLSRVEIY